jgi:hypothetical protein
MLPPNGQLWSWRSYGLHCILCSYACYSTNTFSYANLHSQVQAAQAHGDCSCCIVHVGNLKHASYTMFRRHISTNSSAGVRKSNAAIPPMSLAFDLLGGNLTPSGCAIYNLNYGNRIRVIIDTTLEDWSDGRGPPLRCIPL